jgi:hypothetical protein
MRVREVTVERWRWGWRWRWARIDERGRTKDGEIRLRRYDDEEHRKGGRTGKREQKNEERFRVWIVAFCSILLPPCIW